MCRLPTIAGLAIGWLTEEQAATNQYQQYCQQVVINLALVINFTFGNNMCLGYGLTIITSQPVAKRYLKLQPNEHPTTSKIDYKIMRKCLIKIN